jgi:XTP/dITP diphosphohydrolase
MALLLQNLQNIPDRSAQFRTSITLILAGQEHQFDGVVTGHITQAPSGTAGFGYDPVFIPFGANQTFAQMSAAEKNGISHRGRAIQKLIAFLQTQR